MQHTEHIMKSTIKTLFPSKNNDGGYYGFVSSTDDKNDYYFTSNNNEIPFNQLKQGLEIEFDPVEKDGKRYANNMRLLNEILDSTTEKLDNKNIIVSDSIGYLEYQKQIIESIQYIDEVNDPSHFEDAVHLVLRLLGIHSAYQFDRKKQAGKADGIFTIENLIVMYDCTLNNNFAEFKKDQIENYINKLNQKEQLTVDILKVDGSSTSKMFKIENKKRQVWIITRGKTREINDYDNIKVKEISVFDLIDLLATRIKDSSYDLDRLTSELILLGS